MSDTFTAEDGVAQLMAAESPVEPEAVVEPEEETEGDAQSPDAVEGEEPEAGEDEQDEAEAEPVAAPDKWDAEDKAAFAKLSPDVQALVLEQETKREAVLVKAREKASEEARREVEGEINQVRAVALELQRILPQAVREFDLNWSNPDWNATFQQLGAEETMRLKIVHEEKLAQLRALSEASEQAEAVARQHYIAEETRKLKELAPELASDATKQQEVATFLLKNGATQTDLENLPAWAAALALDAFKYRNAQAAASAPKPKAPAKPILKPAAGQAQSPSQRSATQLQNRFAQTASREDAVALLLAKGL